MTGDPPAGGRQALSGGRRRPAAAAPSSTAGADDLDTLRRSGGGRPAGDTGRRSGGYVPPPPAERLPPGPRTAALPADAHRLTRTRAAYLDGVDAGRAGVRGHNPWSGLSDDLVERSLSVWWRYGYGDGNPLPPVDARSAARRAARQRAFGVTVTSGRMTRRVTPPTGPVEVST